MHLYYKLCYKHCRGKLNNIHTSLVELGWNGMLKQQELFGTMMEKWPFWYSCIYYCDTDVCTHCPYSMSLCVQTKLQWLCEEVQERESRERRLRRTLQQYKEQMKALKQRRDSELQSLLDRITLQDRLLKDIQSEKKGTNSPQRKMINSSDFIGPDSSAQVVMWSHIQLFLCIYCIKFVYILADFYYSWFQGPVA